MSISSLVLHMAIAGASLCFALTGASIAVAQSESMDDAATPPSPSVQGTPDASTVAITYMTFSTIYVSAGATDGVETGDEFQVVRGSEVIGRLMVQEVSRNRSACAVMEKSAEFTIGDGIALVADTAAGSTKATTPSLLIRSRSARTTGSRWRDTRGENWLRAHGFRGRIGARYLSVQDRSGLGQSFNQPALDVRLEGREVGDSPFDMSIDVRTRRTNRTMPDGESSSDGRSRVYRANASWKPQEGRFSLSAGRQYSSELPALGIFDGATAVVKRARWSAGLLSGTQPDPTDFGFSTSIREHGGFFQLRSAQGSTDTWRTTLGFVASYSGGEINREYAAIQSAVAVGRVSAYFSQDLDLNREWKLEAEGSSLSWTNTYSSLRVQARAQTIVSAGFDNRRSVRLYRDYISPENEFDDTYRQGVWAGVDQRLGRTFRIGAKVKRSTGGSAEQADSYTVNAAMQRPIALRVRTTRFSNALIAGWIHSGSVSRQLGTSLRVELGGGLRSEQSQTLGGSDTELRWTNLMLDYALGRSWYASFSFERSDDGPEANDQVYTTLSLRF